MRVSERTLLRCARSAATAEIDTVAGSGGAQPDKLLRALRGVTTRGRCAALVVTAPKAPADTRAALLSNSACPPPRRRLAARDRSAQAREGAPGSAGWPARLRARQARRADAATGSAASVNTRVQAATAGAVPAIIARLAADTNLLVRDAALSNPACPAASMRAATADGQTRRRIAQNTSCAPGLIQMLAHDESWLVRRGAAANPTCPAETIGVLARDRHHAPRSGVAENPACPSQTLRRLASDNDTSVREHVAANSACPSDLLQELAQDPSPSVRRAVLGNESCPAGLLKDAVADLRWDVLGTVAQNRGCPPALLDHLARKYTKGWDCDSDAISNPSCPRKTVESVAADPNHPSCLVAQRVLASRMVAAAAAA